MEKVYSSIIGVNMQFNYNFTLYESGTQDVFCFTRGENDGQRGSNEIATCLLIF